MNHKRDESLTDVAKQIWDILWGLPSPNDAHKVLNTLCACLLEQDAAHQTEADIRAKLVKIDAHILSIWAERNGKKLAS